MKKGKLYLIPVNIVNESSNLHLPDFNFNVVQRLTYFIVENAKEARANLKKYDYENLQSAQLFELNKHTINHEIRNFLNPLFDGNDIGLMSDAGCPGVADPGSEVIKLAHQLNIEIIPLVGPSSILLSVMSSGFNGQNFSFTGYLPVEKDQRIKKLKEIESLSKKNKQAIYFIETPYRNEALFETMIKCLHSQTLLFVGINLGAKDNLIRSKTVFDWKNQANMSFDKKPCVFGIYVAN
ncbi:MAG: SAM-dependent methyltransferase [Bacteroidetes bacterium]|nr:SAM-dependent methyltransferase [Bacteroidota bacterium]MCA6444720.1 SAM-dependent methyltransferase [Bacteroidota bacterium]